MPMTVDGGAALDFDSLFRAYYGRLTRLLYRITGDASRAEEVAAEAFWRLYRKPPPSHLNLEGWLYRTGVRLALDQLKMERRRSRYEALAVAFGIRPHAACELDERILIRQILAALKPGHAALILLRDEGLSYAELAATNNLNPASVGAALARAEQAFRKEYEKRYGQRESLHDQ